MHKLGLAVALAVTALTRVSSAGEASTGPGTLESVSCEAISGWARDPNVASATVPVELAFDAPLAGAPAGAVEASLGRDDLCAELGSCNHGFRLAPPYSLFDGSDHWVFAYAENQAMTEKKELVESPKIMSCAPPAVTGVRRPLPNTAAAIEWRLNDFWHRVALDDDSIEQLPMGSVLPEAPVIVRADDGTADIWLLDGDARRAVPQPWGSIDWRLSPDAVEERPAAEVHSVPEGPPLRARPMIVRTSLDEVYLVDDGAVLGEPPRQAPVPGELPPYEGEVTREEVPRPPCSARIAGRAPGSSIWPGFVLGLGALVVTRKRVPRCPLPE